MADDELHCEAGCTSYTGGELRHHRDCKHYPESMSKMLDDAQEQVSRLQSELDLKNDLWPKAQAILQATMKERDDAKRELENLKRSVNQAADEGERFRCG